MAADSYVKYTGTGEHRRFNVTFPYIFKENVKVTVRAELTSHYFWFDDYTIELEWTPNEGDIIVLWRDTSSTDRLISYSNSTMLTAEDLNLEGKQLFYLIQESLDRYLDSAMTDDITQAMLQGWVKDEFDAGLTTDLITGKLNGAITESELYGVLNTKIKNGDEAYSHVEYLKDQWTVKLQNAGHVVGVGMNLHDIWDEEVLYAVDVYVWNPGDEQVYKCVYGNIGIDPSTDVFNDYWELVPYGARSEFSIHTDKFSIVNPDDDADTVVPFVVGTVGGVATVGVNGTLVIDGSLTSDKIATDAITVGHIGDTAELLNIHQGWSQVNNDNGGRPEEGADVTGNHTSNDTKVSEIFLLYNGQTDWYRGELDAVLLITNGVLEMEL